MEGKVDYRGDCLAGIAAAPMFAAEREAEFGAAIDRVERGERAGADDFAGILASEFNSGWVVREFDAPVE